jgi:hypothetical protein
MSRYQQRPKRLFRGTEFGRFVVMILMLVVLYMMIQTASDPGTWKWLVSEPGKTDRVVKTDESAEPARERVPEKLPAIAPNDLKSGGDKSAAPPAAESKPAVNQGGKSLVTPEQNGGSVPASMPATSTPVVTDKAASNPAPDASAASNAMPDDIPDDVFTPPPRFVSDKVPPATGPTDEDRDDWIPFLEERDWIRDYQTTVDEGEMDPYARMVRWVMDQTYDRLKARSEQHRNPTFAQFIAAPDDERGKLFQMDVHIEKIVKFDVPLKFHDEDDPQKPVQLYEMWGHSNESVNFLYHFIVYDPPAGMPIGVNLREDVHFAGYFFRVQGYEAPRMPANRRRLYAPSFIGRIAWKVRGPSAAVGTNEWPLFIGSACVVSLVACIWVGFVVFGRRRRSVAEISTDMPIPGHVTIDDWLEDAAQQAEAVEENGLGDENGHFDPPGGNGHSPGVGGLYFPHPHENN